MYLPDQVELLKFFQAFLQQAGLSSVSIKNYLSDLRHFLSFTSPEPSAAAGLTLTTKDIFQNLNQYLDPYLQAQKASFTPANTTARRLASIRRFSTFLHAQFGLAPLQGQALKGTNPQGLALQGVSPAASLSSAKIPSKTTFRIFITSFSGLPTKPPLPTKIWSTFLANSYFPPMLPT
ncbi:MAG: hypothetical protein UX01_C0010G0057 [Candidatus Collierbacteria bacterium GW2011_GWB2_45_17]|uniref:Core-binding (CB) domain-containing protein n=1 Tax=Candidatus Collierbacteria bacterium GW2011_GWB2_45_17 TaxID=1618388 RepID=A0A837IGK0_9BACT|nr:MAG: hypothetical protein UX01_C0010G0057 [Candidatus Collierbacteria bacterium GW2011_GWB2_45_17]